MKRFAFVIALVAVLSLPLAVAGAGTPSGRYSTDISGAKPAVLNGHWTLGFAPKGRYSVSFNGQVAVRGNDTIKGSKITFQDTGGSHKCPATQVGTYTFTLKGSALTFRAVTDACAARRAVLTTHPFHRGS